MRELPRLFSGDERVFEVMLERWRAQMLARRLTTGTIKSRCGVVGRFQEFTGEFPRQWLSRMRRLPTMVRHAIRFAFDADI